MNIETITIADLSDPNIDADTLVEIAAKRGDLLQAVAAHPNCPPALASQIRTTAPSAAVAAGLQQAVAGAGAAFAGVQSGATQFAQKQGIDPKKDWPFLATAGAGLLGFITLFLPWASIPGYFSISLIEGGDGVVVLFLMLAAIAFAVVALFVRKKWTPRTSGIVAIAVGALTFLIAIVDWPGGSGLNIGFGAILLLLVGLALIGTGVVTLVFDKKSRAQQ
mgnify:CR=1 FL=1